MFRRADSHASGVLCFGLLAFGFSSLAVYASNLGTGGNIDFLGVKAPQVVCLVPVALYTYTQVVAEFSQHDTLSNTFDHIAKIRERVG